MFGILGKLMLDYDQGLLHSNIDVLNLSFAFLWHFHPSGPLCKFASTSVYKSSWNLDLASLISRIYGKRNIPVGPEQC